MIYYISKQNRLFDSLDIKSCSVEYALECLWEMSEIGVDTETNGMDAYTNQVLLLQLGNDKDQYVFDNTINYRVFKKLLENKPLILQNAKFDLKFLFEFDIWPNKVYDTYLAECKLTQGLDDVRKNLQALNDKYVGNNLVDKSSRGLIHRGITDTVIIYAANDVKCLPIIKYKQLELAKQLGLEVAIDLENEFVITLAYIEYSGLYVNPDLWLAKVKSAEVKLQESLNTLNNYIIDNKLYKYTDAQLDIFSTQRTVNINWNSEKQVKTLFKDLGINVNIIEKGISKESVEAKVLLPQAKQFNIIPLYLEYKQWEKDLSTYGYKFIKEINSVTGRLHTNFKQIVDTGRMSSGGKDEGINFQNIPSDKETRSCFTNQFEDTILVNCDYSGMESVVMANLSKEPNLIEFYNKGAGDLHSFVASKLFKELEGLSLNEIKEKHKDKRQTAKAANFALSYGGTGFTIAKNLSITPEEGNKVEKAFFDSFTELKLFFDKKETETLKNGYILIDEITGSKYFINKFDEFKELHLKYSFDNKEFWEKYRTEKQNNSEWFKEIKDNLSYYFRWKSQIRRNSQNFPIQGSSASITKIAGVIFYKWIKSNNLLRKVLISNVVHDEFLIECPIELKDEVSIQLKFAMEKAGSHYCKLVPLEATPVISNSWQH